MNMTFFTDAMEFRRRVQTLHALREAHGINLPGHSLSGMFREKSIPLLTAFCEAHPEYHIVSSKWPYVFNRYVPNSGIYYLAEGDQDPGLTQVVISSTEHLFASLTDQQSWNSILHRRRAK